MELGERIIKGDKRAAARLITLIENKDPDAIEVLKKLYRFTGHARVIGITGPPGAGKSTVVCRMASYFLESGKKVGIIAVDPTSPFTGGAILGDRIRMQELSTNPNVFIRSMGNRGQLGGVARASSSAVRILDAFGCDYIFVETVGVGQSEIDIVKLSDTVVIILVPGLGDDIQAIKAGIMEIGDIFVVNKADRDGTERVMAEINASLDFQKYSRRPPVIKTIGTTGIGIDELVKNILEQIEYLETTNNLKLKRKNNSRAEIIEILKQNIMDSISGNLWDTYIDELSMKVSERDLDPYTAAGMILMETREMRRT